MKRIMSYVLCASALILGWSAIMATSDPPKKFGPEWTKDKDDELIYRRKMEIEVIRRTTWEFTTYSIPLEHHTVNISEADENRGVEVVIIPSGDYSRHSSLEVRKDVKGKVLSNKALIGNVCNYDLDGDGMIDAFVDNRKGKSIAKIVFEGGFVEVEQNKNTFGHAPNVKPEVWGLGRKVRYIFEDGTWKVKS